MRSTYKRFLWRATRPVNTADCMNEGRYYLKCIIIDIFLSYFKNISTLHDVLPAKQTACTYCAWLWNWLIECSSEFISRKHVRECTYAMSHPSVSLAVSTSILEKSSGFRWPLADPAFFPSFALSSSRHLRSNVRTARRKSGIRQ